MKTIQKLEIGAGLITLAATVIACSLLFYPALRLEAENERWDIVLRYLIAGFVLCIVPACLLAVGSIFHALRQSQIGFVGILIGGVTLVLLFCLSALSFSFYLGWLLGLAMTTPGFLAAFTILLAFRYRKVILSPK